MFGSRNKRKRIEKKWIVCVCVSEREGDGKERERERERERWERRHKKSDWKKIEIKNYPK